ncbi:transketolase [Actinomycetaceae bacterium WB03_NA08]|uniref:Transketolase n=1 Tax=Scrofimicrobium canadense TaxID=2652290 RepID=A0A6N7W6B1_9ACTO|nr:transketolase [Scrofimicrobium canadense]
MYCNSSFTTPALFLHPCYLCRKHGQWTVIFSAFVTTRLAFVHFDVEKEWRTVVALKWDERDDRAVTTAKLLAADAVEEAGSGHPGTPISLAAAAYLIYQRYLRFDPRDPQWVGRDRFVLSAGHASLLQYVQLYLAGVDMEMSDLQSFRTFGSKTPGHPERGHTAGIEITTGPLGSGLGAAVGMAMSARREHGMFDPETPLGQSPFDHDVYVIAGDGCMQEGVASEAASLAGTQQLGNLILIYDDNHISIEDDTNIAFNEDVLARFEAYGWHTQRVNWLQDNGEYQEDVVSLADAIDAAKSETSKPSIIALRTIIGWPSPDKQNTGGIHGAKLGSESLAALKKALGADPEKMFDVDPAIVEYTRENALIRANEAQEQWDEAFRKWAAGNPDKVELFNRIRTGELPKGWEASLPVFEAGKDLATRSASGAVLNGISGAIPELWGGSADLAGSNNTYMKGQGSFLPPSRGSKMFPADLYGRNLHFGVREHGMGAIMNGMASDGLTRVYGATFFVFADYMRGAVRLASLMNLPVTYVWTHDSIGVGEDGPTHQPVEHLAAYRAIPNLAIVRPGDADETAQAWKNILEKNGPAGLILTRQNLPNPGRNAETGLASAEGVARGGYIIADSEDVPDVILMASGSELHLALAAREVLGREGVAARVVSMPCMEWFDQQDKDYRDSVLLPEVKARVSVEAGLAAPWLKYVGDAGKTVSIETFGAPGAAGVLFEEFGITTDAVVAAARSTLNN